MHEDRSSRRSRAHPHYAGLTGVIFDRVTQGAVVRQAQVTTGECSHMGGRVQGLFIFQFITFALWYKRFEIRPRIGCNFASPHMRRTG
jgi:hypothetical protein